MGSQQQQGHRPQLRPVTLEEIIQTDVVTAASDTPVATVVAQMADEDVGSVVIVEENEPVGIVTDRSIALALEETPSITDENVDALLNGNLVTETTETTVFDAIDTLDEADVRRLPIVDDDGKLEGIVTLDDIVVLLGAELDNAASVIKSQTPRY